MDGQVWWPGPDGRWYPTPPPPPRRGADAATLATLAVISGFIGVGGGWIPLFGIMFAWTGPIAVVLAIRALRAARAEGPDAQRRFRTASTLALLSGILGTCFFALWLAIFIVMLARGEDPFGGL